jgi:hypothetical protein
MTAGSNPIHSKHIVAIVGDLHAADFLLLDIGRCTDGYKTSLPGGFYDFDDIEPTSPEIAEGMRAILAEHANIAVHFLPGGFDFSGSMPDTMLREMAEEINTIMGDFLPMEMAPREVEDRMMAMLHSPAAREARALRIEYDAMVDMKRNVDLPFFDRDRYNGAPRSIKETRRAQGRGRKASAMRGWKRK